MKRFLHAFIAAITKAILIVQGATNLQIGPEHADTLAAACKGCKKGVIAGMNHLQQPAPADRVANFATCYQPHLPLASGWADAIVKLIKGINEQGNTEN